jgi:uncharacterized membrane protein
MALDMADASQVAPLLTFNPAFTLLIAWLAHGEIPAVRHTVGTTVALLDAYLLEVEEKRMGLLAPLRALVR